MGELHWQPEHEKALKNHVLAGMSLREAAGAVNSEFNTSFSRDAALGKAWRMGVKSNHKRGKRAATGPRKPRAKRVVTTALQQAVTLRHTGQRFPAVQTEAQIDNTVPRRVSLLELTDETCRWPIGDVGSADFCFCGNPPLAGIQYCSGHARIAFRIDQRRG